MPLVADQGSGAVAAIVAGSALVAGLVAVPLAMRLARSIGVMDRPGPLKVHSEPVPYLGGLGVAVGLAIGLGAARPGLIPGLAIALLVGLADDVRPLPPWLRLIGQMATGAVIAAAVPVRLPSPVGPCVVVLLTVLLVNGVNMIDGLDGLAAGVALVSTAAFAVLLSNDGRLVALAAAGSLVAFLVFNRPPARVYLGDAGSYLIGALFASLVVLAWQPARRWPSSLGALLLVAYPVAELIFAVLRRARAGLSPLMGDRDHVYDKLIGQGWSVQRAVSLCVLTQAILCGVGLAAAKSSTIGAATLLGLASVVVVVTGAEAGLLRNAEPAG